MTDIDIQHLSRLAQLELSTTEAAEARDDLHRIVEMIDLMQSVDTDGVEPLAHPLDASQRLRPDEVTEPENREELQSVAPSVADGLYLVPRVIE